MPVENLPESDPNGRTARAAEALVALMARLRDPAEGCPWDRAQTFETIAPYTIEEAYEVADAIDRGALPELKEELGDLLFQVAFHARLAQEQGAFDFADVAAGLVAKMRARHPHVFAEAEARTAGQQSLAWEALKAEERAAKRPQAGVLDGVARALPALARAEKLTKRAARIGFDWPQPDLVLEKLAEELSELAAARAAGDAQAIQEEMGDVLFAAANLARKLDLDPEDTLRRANAKFERRFRAVETLLAERGLAGAQDLDVLEGLWREVKRAERA